MLYTRKGDTGTSGLFGTKERFPKGHEVYEALGSLDELNSLLGLCRAKVRAEVLASVAAPEVLLYAQEQLFVIQAELAGAPHTLSYGRVEELEGHIAEAEARIANPHAFVIPGTTELSALFDVARAVARRAERAVVRLDEKRAVSPGARAFLNRLSSLLYALARLAANGAAERSPSYI